MPRLQVSAAALLLAVPGLLGAQSSKSYQKTLALDNTGEVRLETYKGSVKISAWDRPEVQVSAEVVADDSCGDDKDKAEMVRDTEVRIEGGGARVRIESDYDRVKDRTSWHFFSFGSCSSLPAVHYTVSMPRTAKLELKDYKSELQIADLSSDVRLTTYKGDTRITGLAGSLHFDTYKGDARISFTRMAGQSSFETHKGNIEISVPRNAPFTLDAEVGSRGRLDSDFPVLTRATSRRGERVEGSVNGGGPQIRLTTSRGSFRLRSS